MRVVQDGNCAILVGRLADLAELETYLQTRLASFTINATVTTFMDTGTITTQVRVPVEDVVAEAMFTFMSGYKTGVINHQFIEFRL